MRLLPRDNQRRRAVTFLSAATTVAAVMGAATDFTGVVRRLSCRVTPAALSSQDGHKHLRPLPYAPRLTSGFAPLAPAPSASPLRLSPYGTVPACVAFSPDGRTVYLGGNRPDSAPRGTARGDAEVGAWDVRTGEPIWCQAWPRQEVWGLAPSPDGRSLLELGHGFTTVLAASQGHASIGGFAFSDGVIASPTLRTRDVAFLAGGTVLAVSGGWHGRNRRGIPLYTTRATGGRGGADALPAADADAVALDLPGSAGVGQEAYSVAASPSGRYLAAVLPFVPRAGLGDPAARGLVNVWEMPGRRLLWSARLLSPDVTVRFSPDGKSVACAGGAAGEVALFDAQTGEEQWREQLSGLRLGGVAFSADGEKLFCSDGHGGAYVWLTHSGRPAGRLIDPADPVDASAPARKQSLQPGSIAASPNGRWLASVGSTHVSVWDLAAVSRP
jgi:WD40 repeat protein